MEGSTEGGIDVFSLLEYLHGSSTAAQTASCVIEDLCTDADLPRMLHDICATLLVHKSWETRANAANLLGLLATKFELILRPMATSTAHNVRSILSVCDIRIDRVLDQNTKLYSCDVDTDISSGQIYSEKWLQKQKRELKKRLLLETSSIEVKSSLKHGAEEFGVQETDFVQAAAVEQEAPVVGGDHCNASDTNVQNVKERKQKEDELPTRNWFISIINYLTIGVLSPCWEVRHGCGIGLSKILLSFLKGTKGADHSIDISKSICEDIVCFGIYALLLDRYIDCAEGTAAVSPVKEVMAQMVGLAATLLPDETITDDRLISMAYEMISCAGEWMVRHAGFMILKYFIPSHLRDGSDRLLHFMSQYLTNIFEHVLPGLHAALGELVGVCCDVIHAVGRAIETAATGASGDDKRAIAAVVSGPLEGALNSLHSLSQSSGDISDTYGFLVTGCLWCVKALVAATDDASLVLRSLRTMFSIHESILVSAYPAKQSFQNQLRLYAEVTDVLQDISVKSFPGVVSISSAEGLMSSQDALIDAGVQFIAVALLFCQCNTSDVSGAHGNVESVPSPWMFGLGADYERLYILECMCLAVARIVYNGTSRSKTAAFGNKLMSLLFGNGGSWTPTLDSAESESVTPRGRKRRKVDNRKYVDDEPTPGETVMTALLLKCQEKIQCDVDGWLKREGKYYDSFQTAIIIRCFLFPESKGDCFMSCALAVCRSLYYFIERDLGSTDGADWSFIEGMVQRYLSVQNELVKKVHEFLSLKPDQFRPLPVSAAPKCRVVINIGGKQTSFREKNNMTSSFEGTAKSTLAVVQRLAAEVLVLRLSILLFSTRIGTGIHSFTLDDSAVNSMLLLKEDASSLPDSLIHGLREALEPMAIIPRIDMGNVVQELISYLISLCRMNSTEGEYECAKCGILPTIVMCVCDISTNGALMDGVVPTGFSVLLQKILSDNEYDALAVQHVVQVIFGDTFSASWAARNHGLLVEQAWNINRSPDGITEFKQSYCFLKFVRSAIVNPSMNNCVLKSFLNNVLASSCVCLFEMLKQVRDCGVNDPVGRNMLSALHKKFAACRLSEGEEPDEDYRYPSKREMEAILIEKFSIYMLSAPEVFTDGAEESGSADCSLILDSLQRENDVLFRTALSVIMAVAVSDMGVDLSVRLEIWTRLVLEGSNLNHPLAKRSSMLCLSKLVPLQSLGLMSSCPGGLSTDIGLSTQRTDNIIAELQRVSHLARNLGSGGAYIEHSKETGGRILRNYQWKGVQWITELWRRGFGGGILADEMGLGKTIQAISAILWRRIETKYKNRPSLVICPPSLVQHWLTELRLSITDESCLSGICLGDISTVSDDALRSLSGDKVLIVSYNNLRQYESVLAGVEFEVIVVDEAHCMRNASSALSMAIFSLQSRRRLALSGTPVQNEVADLWSVMNFLLPDFLGDYKKFRKNTVLPILRYFRRIDKKQGGIMQTQMNSNTAESANAVDLSVVGLEALHKLHKQILLFILRRKKDIVAADLPPKSIVNIFCPLSTLQKEMYSTFQNRARMNDEELFALLSADTASVSSKLKLPTTGSALQALTYLKLLSVHPSLVIDQQAHREYHSSIENDLYNSGKLAALLKVLVESDVVPSEEVLLFKGSAELSNILSPDVLAGGDVISAKGNLPSTAGARTSATRQVVLSRAGKKMPVFRNREAAAAAKPTLTGSDSSSESSDDDEGRSVERTEAIATKNSRRLTKKCLVFAQHRGVLAILESLVFKKYFPFVRYARLDGSMSPMERSKIIDDFTNDDTSEDPIRILLMTTRSCGLGLNLSAADTVIFVEMDWNPFVDMQAMDRAHRIGQKRPVTVFRLVADSTIESRIIQLQTRKEAVASEIVNEDNAGASGTTNALLDPFSATMWRTLATVSSINNSEGGEHPARVDDIDMSPSYECFDVGNFMRDLST